MLINLFSASEPCSVIVLLAVLASLGHYIVGNDERLRLLGWRIGYGVCVLGVGEGFLLGHPENAAEWLGVIFRALLVGGLAVAITWIALPPICFLYVHGIAETMRRIEATVDGWQQQIASQARQRQEEEERRRAAIEWERTAPEREAAQREAEARAQAAELARRQEAEERARREAECRRRRDGVRGKCEIVYALYGPDIRERFDKNDYSDFVRRFLGDERPPEEVEERGEQLMELIHKHLAQVDPLRKFTSLADLSTWYERQHEQLSKVGDERLRRSLVARLNERYADLSVGLMEN